MMCRWISRNSLPHNAVYARNAEHINCFLNKTASEEDVASLNNILRELIHSKQKD
jgi:hypothetical protein